MPPENCAAVDEEIVGMAEIEPDGFIDYFYVHPAWQGRGVGKALLAALESEAAQLGVKMIWADVSITANEFFLSRGFRITESRMKSSATLPQTFECRRR